MRNLFSSSHDAPNTSNRDERLIWSDQLNERNLCYARGTSDRDAAGNFYLLRISDSLKSKLKIKNWAAIVFEHPLSQHTKLSGGHERPENISGYTVVHCKVEGLSQSHYAQSVVGGSRHESAQNSVEIDQTLRNALGIPFWIGSENSNIPIYVYPLRYNNSLKKRLSEFLGQRYLYYRVAKSAVPDIEKNIARIESSYFPLLGMPVGYSIVAERPIKSKLRNGKIAEFTISRQKIKAFAASNEFLKNRSVLQKNDPIRYFPANEHLYNPDYFKSTGRYSGSPPADAAFEPDIPTIFVDHHFRNFDISKGGLNAGMTDLTAVSVTRDTGEIFLKEMTDFGVAFAVSLLPLAQLVYSLTTSASNQGRYFLLILGILLPAFFIGLLVLRIRRQVF